MDIAGILRDNNFRFKKNLGQNFITDINLLNAIVSDAGISADDTVLEVGTGAGTLTKALSRKAKKVYSFEIDTDLQPVLAQTLKGEENIEVHFKDVLRLTDKEIKSIIFDDFKVVANLPYYITTNLIMRFIESDLNVGSITIMVQKEVADRLTAAPDTSDYGAITLAVKLWGKATIKRLVKKDLFFPQPKVDSAIINIEKNSHFDDIKDKKKVIKLIKAAFHMRRKTFVNNLIANFSITKPDAITLLRDNGFAEKVRGESLSLEDLVKLSNDDRLK